MAQAQPQQQSRPPSGFTPDEAKTFVMFVQNGDLAMMKFELKTNPALANARDEHGSPVLHRAVEEANEEAVDLLLQNNANPGAVNEFRETAAHLALRMGFATIAGKIRERANEIELAGKAEKMRRDYDRAIQGFVKGPGKPMQIERAEFKPRKKFL